VTPAFRGCLRRRKAATVAHDSTALTGEHDTRGIPR
jgi:hypothetical protein